jgi:MFS family permease
MLTSVYNIPNVVLCFFSGPIVEYMGLRTSAVVFSLLLFIGHMVFALAPLVHSFIMAVAGRLILGYLLHRH